MKYIPRPGVVLTKVCGANLLVPTRAASEYCPNIIRLSGLLALDWNALQNGKTIEMLYKGHEVLKHISPEEAREEVDSAFETLCRKGFLIPDETAD